jgi:hypothetical protein
VLGSLGVCVVFGVDVLGVVLVGLDDLCGFVALLN